MDDFTTDNEFMGEHVEGMGDAWNAFFGEAKQITDWLPKMVTEGKARKIRVVHNAGEEMHVTMLEYPTQSGVRIGMLVVKKQGEESAELWSCTPIFEGVTNNITIQNTHAWENGLEGVVAGKIGEDGPRITFYAPYYYYECDQYDFGAQLQIKLAGLALIAEKAEPNVIAIDKGPFFEIELQKFLHDNKGKTRSDFKPPVLSMAGSKILFPTKYACEWSFRCPVLAVEEHTLCNVRFFIVSTGFAGDGENPIHGHIALSERILHGYEPKVGDDIQGVLWMTGVIDQNKTSV